MGMETMGHLGVPFLKSQTSEPLNHFGNSYPTSPSNFSDELWAALWMRCLKDVVQ